LKGFTSTTERAAGGRASHRLCREGGRSAFQADSSSAPQSVFKSDVKSYYASIDHDILVAQIYDLLDDPIALDFDEQYICRTVYHGAIFRDVELHISLGYSLSLLMGAVYFKPLDDSV